MNLLINPLKRIDYKNHENKKKSILYHESKENVYFTVRKIIVYNN